MTQTCSLPTICKACKGPLVKGACQNEECIWYSTLCDRCGNATDNDEPGLCETCWNRHEQEVFEQKLKDLGFKVTHVKG